MICDELKRKIILKCGLTEVTSSDCKKIAADITRSLNRQISTTTIKRVLGFAVSKYSFSAHTLVTLQEFVAPKNTLEIIENNDDFLGYTSYLSALKSYPKLKISSFIDENRFGPYKSIPEFYLHPDHIVVHALKTLQEHNLESCPIFKNDKYIGEIYTKDLLHFLYSDNNKDGLLYHKLNFELRIAIIVMNKTIK